MEVTKKSERAFQILTIPVVYMGVTVLYTTFNESKHEIDKNIKYKL